MPSTATPAGTGKISRGAPGGKVLYLRETEQFAA